MFQIVQYFIHFILLLLFQNDNHENPYDQNRHGQRPIVVSTWFPARWPFSVAYWSCCFRVRGGLLGRFVGELEGLKCHFFLKHGVFCPGSILKSLWVAGPPTIQRQRYRRKGRVLFGKTMVHRKSTVRKGLQKKHLKFSMVKNYS